MGALDSVSSKDWIFFEVPLTPKSLDALQAVAKQKGTTPMLVLQEIVGKFQRNGRPPVVEVTTESVQRGVPVTPAQLRTFNEMAAEYKISPTKILQGIVESEFDK